MGHSVADFVWNRDEWRCRYCGQEVVYDRKARKNQDRPRSNTATVDHLVLRSEGGHRTVENLVTACWSCNHDRGDLSVHDFIFGNPDIRHSMKASRSLHQRISQVGDWDYALTVPLDLVLTAYDNDDMVTP